MCSLDKYKIEREKKFIRKKKCGKFEKKKARKVASLLGYKFILLSV